MGAILMAALLIYQHPEPTVDGYIAREVDPKFGQLVTSRDDGPYCVTYLAATTRIYINGKLSEPAKLKLGQIVDVWQDGKRNAILVLASSKKD